MNILMVTNLYTPHVGGVARSVERFTDEYRKLGHHVLVVAPTFEDLPEEEHGVVRVAALQNFNGTDFSVKVPVPNNLNERVRDSFQPDVVHSHHPFLLGATAMRIARACDVPLVYTFHTRYEFYTHYVPFDNEQLGRFVINLTSGYCNLADRVIAPSTSMADLLRERGVETPVSVIPTGVYPDEWAEGDGAAGRRTHDVPQDAFVVGHLGRLEKEKNLDFLMKAVAAFMHDEPTAHFLAVGKGEATDELQAFFREKGMADRLHLAGTLQGDALVNAYHAMDVFTFASKSETQGMVLLEAMASGTPVVALDAPGAADVVDDRRNGRLVEDEDTDAFARAVRWIHDLDDEAREELRRAALATARENSMEQCARRALELYEHAHEDGLQDKSEGDTPWDKAIESIKTEWDLLKNTATSMTEALEGHRPNGAGSEA